MCRKDSPFLNHHADSNKTLLLTDSSLNWREISPTIFGAVFESTLNPETRRSGGMHYTSIENIHKLIDPLFQDALKAELAEIEAVAVERTRKTKLEAFQRKLAGLKFLDPDESHHGQSAVCGKKEQTKEQKQDLTNLFDSDAKRIGNLDYVSGWYVKAGALIQNTSIRAAFVSTNSITQGEQVSLLWRVLIEKYSVHIDFAYRTFKWESEAKDKAAVHCVIIGFSTGKNKSVCRLYNGGISHEVSSINPTIAPVEYLQDPNLFPDLTRSLLQEGFLELVPPEEYVDAYSDDYAAFLDWVCHNEDHFTLKTPFKSGRTAFIPYGLHMGKMGSLGSELVKAGLARHTEKEWFLVDQGLGEVCPSKSVITTNWSASAAISKTSFCLWTGCLRLCSKSVVRFF